MSFLGITSVNGICKELNWFFKDWNLFIYFKSMNLLFHEPFHQSRKTSIYLEYIATYDIEI